MPTTEPTVMDMHKRDRFELLNAYLDGEVTAAERRQIEDWLTTDSGVQCLYARALKLRQEWQIIPMPLSQQPVKGTLGQMFPCMKTKSKMAAVWGTTVLAAVLIGALSGVLWEHQSPVPTMAQAPQLTVKPGQ